jgi:hypothetical protein
MGFIIAGHAMVWTLWRPERSTSTGGQYRYLVLAFTLAGVLSAALYAPMLEQVFQFMSHLPTASKAVTTPSWAVAEVLKGLRVGLGTIGVVGAAVFALVGLVSYGRESRTTLLLFLMPAVVTLAGVIAMRAPIRPRFFFSFLGFALLFLVRGAMEAGTYIERRWATRLRSTDGTIIQLVGQRVGLSVVTVIVLLSLGSVRYAYAYPKQDFDGALEFLRDRRTELEPVGTAGLASYPYARYYRQPWSQIETRDQFDRLRASGKRTWMVYSFPQYMEPQLVESLRQHCPVERAFHGTLDGGDVIVCSVQRQ